MSDSGTYVYAVSRGLDPAAFRDVAGVGGAPVRTVQQREQGDHGEQDTLTAIVSTVDLDEFGEAALRRNLENMSWLETAARAHHHVVDTAGNASSATTPLRLATVYYSDDRVRAFLAEEAPRFARALERITGRAEWGVKAYADPDAYRKPGDSDTPSSPDGASSPGAAYLRRRREERQSDEDAAAMAAEHADAIHTALRDYSVAYRLHRPHDPGLSGHIGWMVLNGAYLIEQDHDREFGALVARLAQAHPAIHLEVTGPWAPYSFAEFEDEQPETSSP